MQQISINPGVLVLVRDKQLEIVAAISSNKMTNPVFNAELGTKVNDTKLLVVGAGGIGCELLKNLVLTGFKDITVVSSSLKLWMSFSTAFFCSDRP